MYLSGSKRKGERKAKINLEARKTQKIIRK